MWLAWVQQMYVMSEMCWESRRTNLGNTYALSTLRRRSGYSPLWPWAMCSYCEQMKGPSLIVTMAAVLIIWRERQKMPLRYLCLRLLGLTRVFCVFKYQQPLIILIFNPPHLPHYVEFLYPEALAYIEWYLSGKFVLYFVTAMLLNILHVRAAYGHRVF